MSRVGQTVVAGSHSRVNSRLRGLFFAGSTPNKSPRSSFSIGKLFQRAYTRREGLPPRRSMNENASAVPGKSFFTPRPRKGRKVKRDLFYHKDRRHPTTILCESPCDSFLISLSMRDEGEEKEGLPGVPHHSMKRLRFLPVASFLCLCSGRGYR